MSTLHPASSHDHLLGPSALSTTPSIRSSRPASIHSTTSIDTLIATNPQPHPLTSPSQTTLSSPQPYRGFPSQEAYLTALRSWVDSKQYFETDKQLRGWYGTKTKEDYLAKTSIWEERRERKQMEKRERERVERLRRKTVVAERVGVAVVEDGEGDWEGMVSVDTGEVREAKKESKLRRVFGGRTNTVV